MVFNLFWVYISIRLCNIYEQLYKNECLSNKLPLFYNTYFNEFSCIHFQSLEKFNINITLCNSIKQLSVCIRRISICSLDFIRNKCGSYSFVRFFYDCCQLQLEYVSISLGNQYYQSYWLITYYYRYCKDFCKFMINRCI